MKKIFKYYVAIWAVLLAIFNVITFATPAEAGGLSKFEGAFWSGYIFITIAFIGQLVASYFAFKADNKERLFLNIPVVYISYTGLILTLIFGSIAMMVPDLPNWVGVVVCFAILGFNAISVIKASLAGEEAERVDKKVKVQTFFIKSLTVDAETLMAMAKTDEAKEACKKVFEAIRYSDPMSDDALRASEMSVSLKFNEFSEAVKSGEDEKIATISKELVILIEDRNKKCKLLK